MAIQIIQDKVITQTRTGNAEVQNDFIWNINFGMSKTDQNSHHTKL